MPVNTTQARAGANRLLTNLAQTDFMSPSHVLRLLFPMAAVGRMGGLVPTFSSTWDGEEEDDRRASGGDYNVVDDDWGSRPYKLQARGFKYKIGDEKEADATDEGIDVGTRAVQVLMEKTAYKLEREQAAVAGNAANYATGHTAALGAAEKFNTASANPVNPGLTLREGNAVVRRRIGRDPNVLVLGDDTFDALVENPFVVDRTKYTGRDSISLAMIASLYGYELAVKVDMPGTFQGNALSAYVHPEVIRAWRSASVNDDLMGGFRVPYQINGRINRMMSNFGFTYTYRGQPTISNRYFDEDTDSFCYKLRFNRSVEATGVAPEDDAQAGKIIFGYLHTACVA